MHNTFVAVHDSHGAGGATFGGFMILRKWKDGWSLENIAAYYKCNTETVVAYLRKRSKEWVK